MNQGKRQILMDRARTLSGLNDVSSEPVTSGLKQAVTLQSLASKWNGFAAFEEFGLFTVRARSLTLPETMPQPTIYCCCMELKNGGLRIMSDRDQTQVPIPEVKLLADLLQYQEGSIVSRVLLKSKGGTITLFAFDQGEGLSEHTAPFEALVLLVDGEAEVEIGGKTYCVKQGETITLPSNIPHAVKAVKRFKMLLTMLRV